MRNEDKQELLKSLTNQELMAEVGRRQREEIAREALQDFGRKLYSRVAE